MSEPESNGPNWDRLFETAAGQSGDITTKQAAESGYSTHRLVHFPASEHEELVTAWLWSEQTGVISHQTALSLHGLSDVLPAQVHLTLPAAWSKRRFRVPPDVVLHHADVAPEDRAWFSAVPITNPRRTLNDCAREGLSPELLRQAAQ